MIRQVVSHWLLAGYLFMVIYTPPFGPSATLTKYLILVGFPTFGILYLLSNAIGLGIFKKILVSPSVCAVFYCTLVGSVYVAIVRALSVYEINSFADSRLGQNLTPVLMLINAIVAVALIKKSGMNERQGFELVLVLGAFQGLFSLLGLVFPIVKEISNHLYESAGGANEFVISARIFGLSTDFTYGTPIYHGILAGLAFYLLIFRKRNYVLPILLILTTVALNGRTGLLVFGIFLVATLLMLVIKEKRFFSVGFLILGLSAIGYVMMFALKEKAPATEKFIQSFVEDTANLLLEGEATGNYRTLFEGITSFPEGAHFIFGEGIYLYGLKSGFRTDVGFTNDLYSGGLIFLGLLCIPLIVFILSKRAWPLYLRFSMIVAFFIANFKGEVFRSSIILFGIFFFLLLGEVSKLKTENSGGEQKPSKPVTIAIEY